MQRVKLSVSLLLFLLVAQQPMTRDERGAEGTPCRDSEESITPKKEQHAFAADEDFQGYDLCDRKLEEMRPLFYPLTSPPCI